jgi:hypothetical protein
VADQAEAGTRAAAHIKIVAIDQGLHKGWAGFSYWLLLLEATRRTTVDTGRNHAPQTSLLGLFGAY